MPITAKDSGGLTSEPVSQGTHVARCTRVIDLGTQHDRFYGKDIHKVMLCFEVADEFIEKDGKQLPKMLSRNYTVSLHEKATLRKTLEAWRGKVFTEQELAGFDVANILNAPCMISVVQETKEGKTYGNINAIMNLLKGVPCPEAVSDLIKYEISDGRGGAFDKLPEWVQTKIIASKEMQNVADIQETETSEYSNISEEELPF